MFQISGDGCFDLMHVASYAHGNRGNILQFGVMEAIIQAMEKHWDGSDLLEPRSKALPGLFDTCFCTDVATMIELGAKHAINKAMESLVEGDFFLLD